MCLNRRRSLFVTLPFIFLVLSEPSWAQNPSSPYCNISVSHTLCQYQGANPRCGFPVSSSFSASERELIVSLHNKLRSRVARGEETRGLFGRPQPAASNMRVITWDDELAFIAQRWAEQCRFGQDENRDVDRFRVGQNTYENEVRSGEEVSTEDAIRTSIMGLHGWYSEVKQFRGGRQLDRFQFAVPNAHYTQMMWAETHKVGCGHVTYRGGRGLIQKVVCNYGPAGNIRDFSVYIRARPCTHCPFGTICSKDFPGLCESLFDDTVDFTPPSLTTERNFLSASMESREPKQVDNGLNNDSEVITASPGIEIDQYDEEFTPISNSFEDNIDTLLGVLVQSTTTTPSTTTPRPSPTTVISTLFPFLNGGRRQRPSRPTGSTQAPRQPKQSDGRLSPEDERLLNEILRELHENPRFSGFNGQGDPVPTLDPRDQGLLNEILRELGESNNFRFGLTTTSTTTRRPPPTLLSFITGGRQRPRQRPPKRPVPRQPKLTEDDVVLINQILDDLRQAKNISTSPTRRPFTSQTTFSDQSQALFLMQQQQQRPQQTTTPLPIMVLTPKPMTTRPPRRRPRPRGPKLLGQKIKTFLNNIKQRLPFFGG